MSKADGQQIAIKFTQPITSDISTLDTSAFSVTGREYDYEPSGTESTKEYTIASTEAHPTESNAILLTVSDTENGFRNVDGELTVAYDSMIGNLTGVGGPVDSFSQAFTPADLVRKPDVDDTEHIEVTIAATGTLVHIYYSGCQDDQDNHIEISAVTATGTLTHVDDL
jgi:hypothetical protein